MPTPEKHAFLSASSSSCWLNCTRAPRLCESLPDVTTKDAEEGRKAHALAELKARKKFTPMGTRAFNAALKKLYYSPEMNHYTDYYVEQLTEAAMIYDSAPVVALEQTVDYSSYAPEGFGTADCLMIGGDLLTVADFKYGQGVPVASENNSQMMLYGLGALELYKAFYGDLIRRVRLMIVQPRINNSSAWEISREELERWGEETVKPRAELAFAGEGDFAPSEDTCRFCRAKHTCRARTNGYLALEAFGDAIPESQATERDKALDRPMLADMEIGDVLTRARGLKAWLSDLEEYALEACLAGKEIPGWKAVEGRSIRAFDDPDAAISELITAGVPREVVYNQVPKSLAALEKVLGKGEFARLVGMRIVRPAGKPALVVESDKRPPYNPASAAFGGPVNE